MTVPLPAFMQNTDKVKYININNFTQNMIENCKKKCDISKILLG